MKIKTALFFGLLSLSFSSFGMKCNGMPITQEEYIQQFGINPPDQDKLIKFKYDKWSNRIYNDRIIVYQIGDISFFGYATESHLKGIKVQGHKKQLSNKFSVPALSAAELTTKGMLLRLLTLNEMRYLASKKLCYGTPITPLPDFVCKRLKTVGNLRQEERAPFIYDPNAVFTLRLIHKFRDSVLERLPVDVLRIIRKIVNAERAHEEDTVLDFESHEK